ncbi:hypothetical protein FACS1894125_1060 [Actinomycetota bacterium]|nr:hypothetical protein FACS1894125_1060 [Actinomycetota bacterium]
MKVALKIFAILAFALFQMVIPAHNQAFAFADETNAVEQTDTEGVSLDDQVSEPPVDDQISEPSVDDQVSEPSVSEIQVSETKVYPGEKIHITGTGFTPNSYIDLFFPNQSVPGYTIADSNGDINYEATIPADQGMGYYGIMAYDITSSTWTDQIRTFVDNFYFAYSDSVLHPNAKFSVAVNNGSKGSGKTVSISSDQKDYGTFNYNGNGRVDAVLSLPDFEESTITTITATDEDGIRSRSFTTTVLVPKIDFLGKVTEEGKSFVLASGFLPNSNVEVKADENTINTLSADDNGYIREVIDIPENMNTLTLSDNGGGVNNASKSIEYNNQPIVPNLLLKKFSSPTFAYASDVAPNPIPPIEGNFQPWDVPSDLSGFSALNNNVPRGGVVSLVGKNLKPNSVYDFNSDANAIQNVRTDKNGVALYGSQIKIDHGAAIKTHEMQYERAMDSSDVPVTIPITVTQKSITSTKNVVHPLSLKGLNIMASGLQPSALFRVFEGGSEIFGATSTLTARGGMNDSPTPNAENNFLLNFYMTDIYTNQQTDSLEVRLARPQIDDFSAEESLDSRTLSASGFIPLEKVNIIVYDNSTAQTTQFEATADENGNIFETIELSSLSNDLTVFLNDNASGINSAFAYVSN